MRPPARASVPRLWRVTSRSRSRCALPIRCSSPAPRRLIFSSLTHLPLLSGTGVAACWSMRSRVHDSIHGPSCACALSVLSRRCRREYSAADGVFRAPEQFRAEFRRRRPGDRRRARASNRCGWARFCCWRRPLSPAYCWLAYSSQRIRGERVGLAASERLSDSLLDSLRHQPESLVIGDPDLADLFALVAPGLTIRRWRVPRPFRVRARDVDRAWFENYLCVKRLLSAGQPPPVVNPASSSSWIAYSAI